MHRLLSMVLVLLCVLAGSVSGAVYWDNDTGDQNWGNPVNWSGNGGPTTYPAIDVGTPDGVDECVIGSGVVADEPTKLWLGFSAGTAGSLLIDGGDLVCDQFLHIAYRGDGILTLRSGNITVNKYDVGKYDTGTSFIDMDGGTITTGRDFYVGYEGDAILEMSGGEIHTNKFYVAFNDASSGYVKLDGGAIHAGSLIVNTNAVPSDIDIAGGALILDSDVTSAIEDLMEEGSIVAYGGTGLLQVDYDVTNPGKTTVTASPPPVSDPDPADGETTVAVDVDLGWIAAGWEDSFDVYFGTSYTGVFLADHGDSEFQGNYASPGFDLPVLSYETTYFWRIDGVSAGQTGTGKVFSLVTQGHLPTCTLWDNDSGDQKWQTASNWSDDTGAGVNTAVDMSGAANEPVIGAGTVADEPDKLWIGAEPGSAGSLLVDGGDLDCGQTIYVGFNGDGTVKMNSGSLSASTGDIETGSVVGSDGCLDMAGGTLNCSTNFYVGKRGAGTFKVTSGVVNITGNIYMGHETEGDGLLELAGGTINVAGAGGMRCGYKGTGRIEMSGGVINTPKLSIPYEYDDNSAGYMQLDGGIVHTDELVMGKQGQMNIAGGTLIVDGDMVSTVNEFIDGDLIRGYNASGTVHVEYDTAEYPGKTAVFAYPEPVEWVISFEDGFYGDKLNQDKWQNPNWNGGNRRFVDNVEVGGGSLVLKTILRDIDDDGSDEYTSGTVSSKYFQRFGFWEASFKLCDAPGVNNAFWLNTGQFGPDPYNNPQPIAAHTDRIEVDIQECHWPSELNMNLHDWRPTHVGLGSGSMTVADNLAADFHKYGLLWEEDDDVFWYYDDAPVLTKSLAAADSQSLVETLFSSLVTGWAGTPNANTDGSHMDVDWLRVFKRAPNANKPNPSYNIRGVSVDANLNWAAGHGSSGEVNAHHVYLGTEFTSVNDAARFSPEYKGRVSATTFDAGTLDLNTTYYWRIDEVNDSHKCTSDLNGDGLVDIKDLAWLALDWQLPGGTDLDDLSELASYWLDSEPVTKGYVWRFTTETSPSIPILIDPNTLTATASNNYTDRDPVYAVNGAGMTGFDHASDTLVHKMWMGANSDLPKWFKVDLGGSYSMHHIIIYNFNWTGYTNRGCRNIQVFYSNSVSDPGNPVSNLSNWTAAGNAFDLTQAPGAGDYGTTNSVAPDIIDLIGIAARWISIKVNSHYGGSYCGLSEILFYKK